MGMLIHHTWLAQQEQEKKKPEKPVEQPKEPETVSEPVKRTGGRRKTTK